MLVRVVHGEEKATARERILAAQTLLDRGWGKAVETTATVQLEGEQASALADMSTEQLAEIVELARTTNK